MAEEVSQSGVVYGRIKSWFRSFQEKGLAPKWIVEGVLFKVSATEPIRIGKLALSRRQAYTLFGDYEFVRTYHIRIPFAKI